MLQGSGTHKRLGGVVFIKSFSFEPLDHLPGRFGCFQPIRKFSDSLPAFGEQNYDPVLFDHHFGRTYGLLGLVQINISGVSARSDNHHIVSMGQIQLPIGFTCFNASLMGGFEFPGDEHGNVTGSALYCIQDKIHPHLTGDPQGFFMKGVSLQPSVGGFIRPNRKRVMSF